MKSVYYRDYTECVKAYLTLANTIGQKTYVTEEDQIKYKKITNQMSYSQVPIIHPMYDGLDKLDMTIHIYSGGSGLVTVIDENLEEIGRFTVDYVDGQAVLKSIDWSNLYDYELDVTDLNHISPITISQSDFEEVGSVNPYLRFSHERQGGDAYRLELDVDMNGGPEELIFYPTESYWIISYKDQLLTVNTSGHLYYEESICITDVDMKDSSIDLFIETDGYEPFVYNQFITIDEGVLSYNGGLYGLIDYMDGHGKIYFWNGHLFSRAIDEEGINPVTYKLSTATGYYDWASKSLVDNEAIIGSTILYYGHTEPLLANAKDVPLDVYTMEDWKEEDHLDIIVGHLEHGDSFTVLETKVTSDLAKIQLENGTVGWIGGYHAYWD